MARNSQGCHALTSVRRARRVTQVERYYSTSREHHLYYDDGESHSHDMSKRGYRVIGRIQAQAETRGSPGNAPKAARSPAPSDGKQRAVEAVTHPKTGASAQSPMRRRLAPFAPRPPADLSHDGTSSYVFAALNRSAPFLFGCCCC